jgi:hypothetical protein
MEVPEVIPAVELHGSRADRLRTLDAAIARLQALKRAIGGEPAATPPSELHGPYINAPVWPWFAAGCVLGALFVLLFVVAWRFS